MNSTEFFGAIMIRIIIGAIIGGIIGFLINIAISASLRYIYLNNDIIITCKHIIIMAFFGLLIGSIVGIITTTIHIEIDILASSKNITYMNIEHEGSQIYGTCIASVYGFLIVMMAGTVLGFTNVWEWFIIKYNCLGILIGSLSGILCGALISVLQS
jgi:hypothetical protein